MTSAQQVVLVVRERGRDNGIDRKLAEIYLRFHIVPVPLRTRSCVGRSILWNSWPARVHTRTHIPHMRAYTATASIAAISCDPSGMHRRQPDPVRCVPQYFDKNRGA